MEKDFFKKIKLSFIKQKKNVFKKKVFSPYKVWRRIKIVFTIFFILVIAFGVFIFIVVDKNLFSHGSVDSDVLTSELDKNSIDRLIKILEDKKSNFEYLKTSESKVVDPYQN